MNIEHLRRALKSEWLSYYRKNRHWIVKLGVWVDCQGQNRPSASFILGTLSTLEPQLIQLLPLVVDLNSNPDRIVMALGLNFNPEDELKDLEKVLDSATPPQIQPDTTKLLPSRESHPTNPFRLEDPDVDANGPDQQPDQVPSNQASAAPIPVASSVSPVEPKSKPKSRSHPSTALPPDQAPDPWSHPSPDPSFDSSPSAPTPSLASATQPTQTNPSPANSAQTHFSNVKSSRLPIDTAELNAHELPSRERVPRRRDRSTRKRR